MKITEGTKLGRYDIRVLLGVGGMGEVYLAEDTELGRQVALKVLLSEVAGDEDRVRRFVQEAKAASALNHPNILTVYEIGTFDESRFIATELIKGQTLRDRLRGEPMTLREVLDVAMQTAAALNAAHSAGIVHRDIKPENIMLRDDGFVKVLDFGLAKLAADPNATADSEDATRAQVNTRPGVVMGTVAYMSPEQARGKETDARCDIWSLGVVMYEMLTKRTPFVGETANDSIAAILTKDPPPLDAATPSELQRIIRKSLQKSADERYQTVKDLLLDVKNLKRELEISDELERSQVPHATGSANVGTAQFSEHATAIHSGVISTQNSIGQQRSSAEYIVSEIKSHKLAIGVIALLFVLVIGCVFGAYKYFWRSGTSAGVPGGANMKITRVTATGKASRAAISPDGKYIVHSVTDGGKQSLWIRQTATTSNVQIVPPADIVYRGITFSRDGNFVYLVSRELGAGTGIVSRVPVLGGTPTSLVTNVDSPVTFSPDGQQMAFVRWNPMEKNSGLWLANSDGTNEHRIAMRQLPEQLTGGPAWSADGKVIACALRMAETEAAYLTVVAINAGDGTQNTFTSQRWSTAGAPHEIGRLAWINDHTLVMNAAADGKGESAQLYSISYPDGQVHLITHDLNNYRDVTLSADSTALAAVQSESQTNVWVAPDGDARRARQLTFGKGHDGGRVCWTPDGRIVYDSEVSGNEDVWSIDPAGGEPRQLTNRAYSENFPVVSPDGRYIVFTSRPSGSAQVWIMNVDGSNQRQLPDTVGQPSLPYTTPDSRWVITDAWKMPAQGGLSPDGQLASWGYTQKSADPITRRDLKISPGNGSSSQHFKIPQTIAYGIRPQWSSDGKAIFYVDEPGRVSNIWSYPLDGGQPKQITNFSSDQIFGFAYSLDGKQLAVTRGTYTSDVVLIKDFR